MLITLEHTRACGYCSRGVRAFFHKYLLDYQRFLEEGIEEEHLVATGDSMALQAVEYANGKR